MTSTILSLWYAILFAIAPPASPNLWPTVVYAETDGWHFVVRKNDHFYVLQSDAPDRFKIGDRLKSIQEKNGEQWVLVNDSPRRTSVLVNAFWLNYNDARILSAEYAQQLVARTE